MLLVFKEFTSVKLVFYTHTLHFGVVRAFGRLISALNHWFDKNYVFTQNLPCGKRSLEKNEKRSYL